MRRHLWLAATLLSLAVMALAHERIALTMKEYLKRKADSANPEAYTRAIARLKDVRVGMRTDQFFEKLEMVFILDKKGNGIDGFVEGYLKEESLDMERGKEPDKYLVFGYREPKAKKPLKKFYLVVREKVLLEIGFFDPAEGQAYAAKLLTP